jgi:DNA repair protein RadC
MKRIKDKFAGDRPREKMVAKGVRALSNGELAQVLIGSGGAGNDVVKIAAKLGKVLREKKATVSLDDLCRIPGISLAHATRILAAFELVNRYDDTKLDQVLDSPDNVLPLLADIRNKQQEYFILLTLDGANRLIHKHTITIGTLTASLVHPREVFAPAIVDRAASIIIAHNHPSGSLDPSPADQEVTEKLKRAGDLLGINLIDHIIVTKDDFRSANR